LRDALRLGYLFAGSAGTTCEVVAAGAVLLDGSSGRAGSDFIMKLKEIERLRAIAILLVMNVHWCTLFPFLPEIAHHSSSGVDLFFVISGYVVTLSLVRLLPPVDGAATFVDAFEQSKRALRVFYTRRFFRIVPAALAGILVHRFCLDFFPEQFGSRDDWRNQVTAFFGGIYNYTLAYRPGGGATLGLYWSLSVEEHFYLLLPVLFLVLRTTSKRLASCAIVVLTCTFARRFSHPEVPSPEAYLKYASHLRFDSLMAGVAIALVSGSREGQAAPLLPPWVLRYAILPCCIVLVAFLPGVGNDDLLAHEGFVGLWLLSGVLVAYAGLDRGYVLSFPVVDRVLEYVGSRSYALYLLHLTALRIDIGAREQWPQYERWLPLGEEHALRRTAVLLVASLLAAEAMHRLVERPAIALGRRLTDPKVAGPRGLSQREWQWVAVGLVVLMLVSYRHQIALALGPTNLARGKPVTASSRMDGKPGPEALTNGKLESEFGLTTNNDDDPWAQIDLGEPVRIGTIDVRNRADGFQDQAIPLELSLSVDGVSYDAVATRDKIFTQELFWRVHLLGRPLARYVRLHAKKKTNLCLSEVEVFAGSGPVF
jgi:peptidoglycan/LPS O-acetylase OafA/YrhL